MIVHETPGPVFRRWEPQAFIPLVLQSTFIRQVFDGSRGVALTNRPHVVRPTPTNLDIPALRRAVEEFGQRHPILLAGIDFEAGAPRAVVAPQRILQLTEHPVESGDEPLETGMRAALAPLLWRPFDLENGPLARVFLIKSISFFLFGIVMHHIATDRWSLGVAEAELRSLYLKHSTGVDAQPLAPPYAYEDYAASILQWLPSDSGRARSDFWRETLRDCPAVRLAGTREELSTPLPAVSTRFDLDPLVCAKAAALARQGKTTPFVVFLWALAQALFDTLEADDVVISAFYAGRTHPLLKTTVGMLADQMPLRLRLRSGGRILLGEVKDVARQANLNKPYPSEFMRQALRDDEGDFVGPWFNFTQIRDAPDGQPVRSTDWTTTPPSSTLTFGWNDRISLNVRMSASEIRGFGDVLYSPAPGREEQIRVLLENLSNNILNQGAS